MKPPKLPHLQLELDKLKSCIHCGMCLPACPTYRITGSEAESPRGRLYLMKKMLAGDIPVAQVSPHLDQCLACHGCETVCPSGVEYGQILLSTREDLARRNFFSLKRQFKRLMFRWVLPWHGLLVLMGDLLRFYQRSGLQSIIRATGLLKLIPPFETQEKLLPTLPQRKALEPGMSFGNPNGESVALMVGCVMDIFYNPVHWDTIEVLVANGYHVHIPQMPCCGALAHHAGETDITRTLAKRNIDTILQLNPRWVVINSAGCGSSMKEYSHLLADNPTYVEKARQFSEKVVDVMELLSKKPLAPFKNKLQEKITYHAACHLHHVQKIKDEPIELLSQVPGLKLVPLPDMDVCCGSAGIYNVEHPELSGDLLTAKMKNIQPLYRNKGVTTVVTGNPGCMLQLQKGIADANLPMQVQHPISVLAAAYRDHQETP